MRKQQLRIDSGGAVERVNRSVWGCGSAEALASAILRNINVNADAKNGETCGVTGLSRDWLLF